VSDGAKETRQLDQLPARDEAARPEGLELFRLLKVPRTGGEPGDFFPEAKWQRCVCILSQLWTAVPTGKVKEVAAMLKAIHAQEDASS